MGVENLEIEAGAGIHKIFATWDDNSGIGDALATDVSCLCVYNENMETWHFFSDGSNREATSSDLPWTVLKLEMNCIAISSSPARTIQGYPIRCTSTLSLARKPALY